MVSDIAIMMMPLIAIEALAADAAARKMMPNAAICMRNLACGISGLLAGAE